MKLATVENQEALTFSLSLAQVDDPVLIFQNSSGNSCQLQKAPPPLAIVF